MDKHERSTRVSRFGRQPVAEILKRRGIKRGDAAQQIGVKHSIFNNTLAGHQTPSERMKEGLAELLNLPVEELFTAEPLARKQGKRYRQGAFLSRGDDPRIVRRSKQELASAGVAGDGDPATM